MNTAEILKKLRKEKGMTQTEFAEKINMSRSAYAKYETGENEPTLENLKRIADFYGCGLDLLAGRYK